MPGVHKVLDPTTLAGCNLAYGQLPSVVLAGQHRDSARNLQEPLMELRTHEIVLCGDRILLRPMTESDWDILIVWNSDPDVIFFTEGTRTPYSPEDIKGIYEETSQNAFCFVIEYQGRAIGECWLQRTNIEALLKRHPNMDSRRIDLMIGEKDLWGKGLGTDVIHTLTRFGFERERADIIYGVASCDNPRSWRAFQKVGYRIEAERDGDYDMMLTRREFGTQARNLASTESQQRAEQSRPRAQRRPSRWESR